MSAVSFLFTHDKLQAKSRKIIMALKIDSGNVLGMYGTNFDTHPDWKHDIYVQTQSLFPELSDVKSGNAERYVKHAETQTYWHTEDRITAEQDEYLKDERNNADPINNTPGRGKKNYRRMEYDINKKPNGKGAEEDRTAAEEKKELSKDDAINALKNFKLAICTTASAWGNEPIKQKDYQDQIKLR